MINRKYIRDLLFYGSQRQTGKSTLLTVGVKNYKSNFFLVCRNQQEARRLTEDNPHARCIGPNTVDRLIGWDAPIIFDQEVVFEYLKELYDLNNKNEYLESNIQVLKQRIESLENKLRLINRVSNEN